MDTKEYKFPSGSIRKRFLNLLNTNQTPLKEQVFSALLEETEVTELLHELGTTDIAIGDATAEIMVTTLGPIPSVMYDLEQSTMNALMKSEELLATTSSVSTILTTEQIPAEPVMIKHHTTLFTTLTISIIILLLLTCTIACLIVKKRRYMIASDRDCDPECDGIKQPLIKSGKFSRFTSKITNSAGSGGGGGGGCCGGNK